MYPFRVTTKLLPPGVGFQRQSPLGLTAKCKICVCRGYLNTCATWETNSRNTSLGKIAFMERQLWMLHIHPQTLVRELKLGQAPATCLWQLLSSSHRYIHITGEQNPQKPAGLQLITKGISSQTHLGEIPRGFWNSPSQQMRLYCVCVSQNKIMWMLYLAKKMEIIRKGNIFLY